MYTHTHTTILQRQVSPTPDRMYSHRLCYFSLGIKCNAEGSMCCPPRSWCQHQIGEAAQRKCQVGNNIQAHTYVVDKAEFCFKKLKFKMFSTNVILLTTGQPSTWRRWPLGWTRGEWFSILCSRSWSRSVSFWQFLIQCLSFNVVWDLE